MNNQTETEAKHTEGPYGIVKSDDGHIFIDSNQRNNRGCHICICEIGNRSDSADSQEERDANALRIKQCLDALAGLNPEAVGGVVDVLRIIESLLPTSQVNGDDLEDDRVFVVGVRGARIKLVRAALAKLTSQP